MTGAGALGASIDGALGARGASIAGAGPICTGAAATAGGGAAVSE